MLLVYGWAADLEGSLGLPAMAALYRSREEQLRETCRKLYWDESRRMFADTPARKLFSQHSNRLAILGDVITGEAARDLMLRTLADTAIAQAALFFRYYVHVALSKAGEGDRYPDQLDDWREMIAHGLTTFSETADKPGNPPRSDCHAWSANPNIEIFRTVLGVDSDAPHFARVIVKPHPGKLAYVTGSVPHPKGSVDVSVRPAGNGWSIHVVFRRILRASSNGAGSGANSSRGRMSSRHEDTNRPHKEPQLRRERDRVSGHVPPVYTGGVAAAH